MPIDINDSLIIELEQSAKHSIQATTKTIVHSFHTFRKINY